VAQGASTTESYSYDPVGNRLSSLGVSPYSYNPSNELVSTPTALYVYDSNGNTTSKTDASGTTQYAWDFENRLTSVTLPASGGTVTFKYDPFGRRIYKSSGAGTSIYAYDGNNLVEETNSSGAVVARYSQTDNIDEPLAMFRAGATSYYQADGLGSVTSLTNATGALAQNYSFDSFGKTTPTGSLVNPFQYTARELDTETGLYYYRARYYDPQGGRFLSEDPMRFSGDGNFYRYTRNSPAGSVDPLGLYTPGRHFDMTYGLAVNAFGPKCRDKALRVAQADASVDDAHGLVDVLRMITGRGVAWDKPGPHFPDARTLGPQLSSAVSRCSIDDLGRGLHSLQDGFAHAGLSPLQHKLDPLWDFGINVGELFRKHPLEDEAESETAYWLVKYKDQCLKCCDQ